MLHDSAGLRYRGLTSANLLRYNGLSIPAGSVRRDSSKGFY